MLGITQHGGDLALFESLIASSMWWVPAVKEFLGVMHSNPSCMLTRRILNIMDLHLWITTHMSMLQMVWIVFQTLGLRTSLFQDGGIDRECVKY